MRSNSQKLAAATEHLDMRVYYKQSLNVMMEPCLGHGSDDYGKTYRSVKWPTYH